MRSNVIKSDIFSEFICCLCESVSLRNVGFANYSKLEPRQAAVSQTAAETSQTEIALLQEMHYQQQFARTSEVQKVLN